MTHIQTDINMAPDTNQSNEAVRTQSRFRCPNCGDKNGYFGTFVFHEMMATHPESKYYNKGYSAGDHIGYCKADEHINDGCKYMWVRTTETDATHFVKEAISF